MMNRLLQYIEPEEPTGVPEHYLVRGPFGNVLVSRDTARAINALLRRWIKPRWICFYDLAGSEIWLRPRDVYLVAENTTEQRAYDRQLRRMLDAEENDNTNWT